MLTFRELQNCEGYYYNVERDELLRNVGPGEARCWAGSSWEATETVDDLDEPRFELLTEDVLMPLAAVQRLAAVRFGGLPADRLINRQTAAQSGGRLLTEEAASLLDSAHEEPV